MTTGNRAAAVVSNPRLAAALELAREADGNRLHVALPGVITKYDKATHLADVQPLLSYKLDGGVEEKLAVIPRVPVVHPRSAAAAVFLPLATGDPVTLIFADRSLDQWKASSGAAPTNPKLNRQHDLTDCWAIPGGYPEGKSPRQRKDDTLEIWLKPGTKISITNGTDDLVDLLGQFLDLIVENVNITGNLGYPVVANGRFALLKIKLDLFRKPAPGGGP